MDITTEMIAVAMRKDWDDKCETVGQDLFASTTGFHLSTVARVYKVPWQATEALLSQCLWCGYGVTQVCASC